jgi:hypothetical protein
MAAGRIEVPRAVKRDKNRLYFVDKAGNVRSTRRKNVKKKR